MAKIVQSPLNPCSLDENEQIPAKIWELLRRNTEFKQAVERLRNLDRKARETNRSDSEWKESCDIIADLKNSNPLAALALQWLVPEPRFFASRESDGQTEDGTGHSPDFKHDSWIWIKRNAPQGAIGHHNMRGPEVAAENPDWKNWQLGEALFNCETPWLHLPNSYQGVFWDIWQKKYACSETQEVAFADAWTSVRAALSRTQKQLDEANQSLCVEPGPATKIGNGLSVRQIPQFQPRLTETECGHLLMLTELAAKSRIFAVPTTLLTKSDAVKSLRRLGALLTGSLPERRSHFFGTKAAWRDFVAVESRVLGETEDSAIRHYVLKQHESPALRDARQKVESADTPEKLDIAKQELQTAETNVLQSHSSDVRDNLDYIRKLSALIYPDFSLVKILQTKKELLNS